MAKQTKAFPNEQTLLSYLSLGNGDADKIKLVYDIQRKIQSPSVAKQLKVHETIASLMFGKINTPNKIDFVSRVGDLSKITELKVIKGPNPMPKEIRELKGLKKLKYTNSNLKSLPRWLFELINLEELNLMYNQITELPEELGKLIKLRELNLWNNRLNKLPASIKNLAHLESLTLNEHHLKVLPPEIGCLRNLKYLSLHLSDMNKKYALKELPIEICKLKELVTLEASGNDLTTLPPGLAKLPKLVSIGVTYNKKISIPEEIKTNRKIKVESWS